MNKLYAQSMCSIKQRPAYLAAESMVSTEVDEVRAEADEIEPGWSQVRFYYVLRGGTTYVKNCTVHDNLCFFHSHFQSMHNNS